MDPENHMLETITSLDALIQGLRTQLETEPPKPTIADYLRLLQLRLELGKTHGESDRRPLNVHWVDDESTPEPDPDPTVPWPGDEPLD
jgi:hypothetical protein